MLACWACGTSTNAREDAWSLPVLYCPPCYNHFWDLAVEADKIERKPVPRPRTRMSTTESTIDDEGPTLGASSPKPAKRRKRVTFVEPSFPEPKLDVEHIRKVAVQLDQLTRTSFSFRFKLQRRYRKLQKLQERGRASDASSFLAIDMLMAKNKYAMKIIEDSFRVTQELLDRIERGRVTVYDYSIMKAELVKIKHDLQETQGLVNEVKQFSEETEAEIPTTKEKVEEQAKATTERTDNDLWPEDPPEMKRKRETSTAAKKKKQLVESHRHTLEKLKYLSALNKEREELEMQIQLRDLFRLIDENQSVLEQIMDADDFQRLEKEWLERFRKICAANDLGVPSGSGDDGTEEDIARRAWQKQTEKFLENVERSKYSSSSDSSDSSKKSLGDVREEERVHRSVQDDKGIISQEEKIKRMERDLETAEQLMTILRELEELDVGNSTQKNGEILKKTRRRLAANDLIKRLEGMNIDEDPTCSSSSYQMPETPESLCHSDDSSGNDNERPSSVEPAEIPSDSLASIRFTGKQKKVVHRTVQENVRYAMDRSESRMR